MLSNQELKSSTQKELMNELKKALDERTRVRMGSKTGHIKDTSLVKKNTRYVSRIKTAIKELELDEMVKAANMI